MNCNKINFYNLSDDFLLVDHYGLQGVIDDSKSAMTREYVIYKTYAMENPIFKRNRFANQSVSVMVLLEGEVEKQYFDIKNKLDRREVMEYKGSLYDYTMLNIGELDYVTDNYAQVSIDFEVGMAYNIIEIEGGDTFVTYNNIEEYYIKVSTAKMIGGFDEVIIFNKVGSINSLRNLGWRNIDNYSIPHRLIEVKGDSTLVKVDTGVEVLRFKRYR